MAHIGLVDERVPERHLGARRDGFPGVERCDHASHASDVRNSAKMWPVGWEALEQWGDDVARIEPLAGGVANDVWSVRVKGTLQSVVSA